MGNKSSKVNDYIDCLKFERVLDSENKISIGIGSIDENKSLQVLRIGDSGKKYYILLSLTENENKLTYEFEDNIIMTLEKENNNILITISSITTGTIMSKYIDPLLIKHYKKIDFVSYELDKIYDFIKYIKHKNI
jgi:hypothetical protein